MEKNKLCTQSKELTFLFAKEPCIDICLCYCWRSAEDSKLSDWKILPSVPQRLRHSSQRSPSLRRGPPRPSEGQHVAWHRLAARPALLAGAHAAQEEPQQQRLTDPQPQRQIHARELQNAFNSEPEQKPDSAASLDADERCHMSLHTLQEELQLSGQFVALRVAVSNR